MRLIAAALTPPVRDERDFELQRTPRECNKCDLLPRRSHHPCTTNATLNGSAHHASATNATYRRAIVRRARNQTLRLTLPKRD